MMLFWQCIDIKMTFVCPLGILISSLWPCTVYHSPQYPSPVNKLFAYMRMLDMIILYINLITHICWWSNAATHWVSMCVSCTQGHLTLSNCGKQTIRCVLDVSWTISLLPLLCLVDRLSAYLPSGHKIST